MMNEQMKQKPAGGRGKRIVGIVTNAILYTFLILCLVLLVIVVSSQRNGNDGAFTVLGKQMRVVVSPSMEACEATDVSGYEIGSLPVGTMVFVDVKPEDETELESWYADLNKGDVLTFRYEYAGTQVTITHRIIDIEPKETGGYLITLEGDNRNADQSLLQQVIDTSADHFNYVIGKVTGSSRVLGWLVTLLKNPVALVLVVMVPSAVVIILEIVKIVGMFGAEKEQKQKLEQKAKEEEIESLKRQLAQMQELVGATQPEKAPESDSEKEDLT